MTQVGACTPLTAPSNERQSVSRGLWNVPYERNVFFTGREKILQTLHQQLTQDKVAALSQIQAIHGLGGIGKTQTAVEYAYRHRQDYQAVFWVRAETDLELRTGFVEIARLLNLPQQDAQDPYDTIRAVKHWLEHHPNWLLIFDNADHPKQLRHFRPRQAQGHILLTSRAQTFDMLGIARPVSLKKMTSQEAEAFLFTRTDRESDGSTEQAAVVTIAAELDYLPLALEQAGAYILAQQVSFQDYLKSYRKRRLILLEKSGPIAGDYPESVATTWSLNFREVEATSIAAADLLRVSAFLSPDAIPYELLERGGSKLGKRLATTLAKMSEDTVIFPELLSNLTRYSLVSSDPKNQTYSIARLVQEVIRASILSSKPFWHFWVDKPHRLWAERAIGAVTQAFPNAEYGNWLDCDRLLPHAKVSIQLATTAHIESETIALLLDRTGYYLNECAQYSEAESLYQESLAMRKRLSGNDHPSVASSLNNLAGLYENQGRYSEAESLYQESLAMRKRLLGEDHPDVATILNNLAVLYNTQGRYSEAESLYQESLAMKKWLSGNDHPDVALRLNNLARLYQNQGRYSEAESLNQESLAMRKRLLGDEHPDVASSLNYLAGLYNTQGRYSEAESLYQESLAMRKRLLGDDHPDVASSL
ncbi:MAG: FxSxx-COOH system tetratricopeptide repeat protein, partial [Cyanobacteria bacterium P01_F01_bin.53]